jgi:sugar/nucleoside kinase (ribokinase family)
MEKPVLIVGLVCIDKILVVDKYPEEDTDLPAIEAYQARGGNAGNNCTVLVQFLQQQQQQNVEFLGTLPKPEFGNQFDFVNSDFEKYGIKVSKHCPLRIGDSWPGEPDRTFIL